MNPKVLSKKNAIATLGSKANHFDSSDDPRYPVRHPGNPLNSVEEVCLLREALKKE